MESNVRDPRIKLAILTLKDLVGRELPDFMKVGYQIKSIEDINDYITKLLKAEEFDLYLQRRLTLNVSRRHPLETY